MTRKRLWIIIINNESLLRIDRERLKVARIGNYDQEEVMDNHYQ